MPNEQRWSEDFRIAGGNAVKKIKDLIRQGNVQKLIIKRPDGTVLKELTVSQGAAIGGALAFLMPQLVAIGAIAALLDVVHIEVIRDAAPADDPDDTDDHDADSAD